MVFTQNEIDRVLGYKSWSNKRKEDKLLRMDCSMYCHLGTDSNKKEREEVTKASRKIYTAIKSINHNMGTLFLQTMDKNVTKEPL
jgi:hypothetical protein